MEQLLERPTNLADHPAEDRAPSWSPDGRWFAFAARVADGVGADAYLVSSPVELSAPLP